MVSSGDVSVKDPHQEATIMAKLGVPTDTAP
jgi:hypothetical protein